jgi:hypothetical protein
LKSFFFFNSSINETGKAAWMEVVETCQQGLHGEWYEEDRVDSFSAMQKNSVVE